VLACVVNLTTLSQTRDYTAYNAGEGETDKWRNGKELFLECGIITGCNLG